MTISKMICVAAVGLASVTLTGGGCDLGYNHSNVLVLTNVNVPAGGGSASVNLQATAGQQVTISLAAQPASLGGRPSKMVPFGNLVGPDGSQTSTPAANSASNGFNSATVTIANTGLYRLDVSDNSKTGGEVTVRVEVPLVTN